MRISVIIPVYGVEKYLDKCVESVVNQTYKDIEIILIDDGGKDKCPEMCDDWAKRDNRIIVIHKENGGQGLARNAGLDIATGEYILFVDSDDYIELNMVDELVKGTDDGKHDIVLCGYKVANSFRKLNNWYKTKEICNNEELIYRYVYDKIIITGPVCKLFRRTLFDSIRFPNFRANEDAFIMHRLIGKSNTSKIIEDCLYIQNIRYDSTEQKSFNKNKLHLIECEKDLRNYILLNYPQFLEFVVEKPAYAGVGLLKKIYMSKNYTIYNDTALQLMRFLDEEKNYLQNNFPDSGVISIIDNLQKNPKKFKRKAIFKGYLRRIKNNCRKIVFH